MRATASLDAQELLHLGIHAVGNNDPTQAVDCLKRCLEIEPAHPQATYMLGALYAQIGLYDRAKDTLTRAVELNPAEHTASFQLGLLHLTGGEIERAQSVWLSLDALPGDHCFNLFRSGLLALVRDEFAQCAEYLERGIQANTLNEPLNADMRKVRDSALASVNTSGAPAAAAAEKVATNSALHFLERYKQQNPR